MRGTRRDVESRPEIRFQRLADVCAEELARARRERAMAAQTEEGEKAS
jgi:hypothetical protein